MAIQLEDPLTTGPSGSWAVKPRSTPLRMGFSATASSVSRLAGLQPEREEKPGGPRAIRLQLTPGKIFEDSQLQGSFSPDAQSEGAAPLADQESQYRGRCGHLLLLLEIPQLIIRLVSIRGQESVWNGAWT